MPGSFTSSILKFFNRESRRKEGSLSSYGSATSVGPLGITGTVGGCTNGVEKFSDIEVTITGVVTLDDRRRNSVLDRSHPIRQIKVYGRDNIVVGIEATYQLTDGTLVPLARGETAGNIAGQVILGESERLSAVHGRAGTERNSNCESVIFLGFVVADLATGYVRTEGPFPNGTNRGEREDGIPFHAHDVFAFGGFERVTDRRLSGLYFYSEPRMMSSSTTYLLS